MYNESVEGKMDFEEEEEVPQAQVPANGEPLARPPTVACATSPEGCGLPAQPGVGPPLQATAEIPGVEVTVAMGSAWVSPGVPVTCPGVTVGLGVAARQPLAAWKLPLIATNLLVSKLNNCVVAAHPLLPPTDVDSLGSVTHSGGEARSLLRLRGGGHEDEDQENLGKNTENTGKVLAISDSSATWIRTWFFARGFSSKYPSGSVFARRRNAFSTGCTGKYSTGGGSTSHRRFFFHPKCRRDPKWGFFAKR